MKWFEVSKVSDDKSFIQKISAGGKRLCLIKQEGKYFAIAAKCPHAGADLSNGWCEHGKIICPFHRYAYDLSTGRGTEGQGDYVQTYPVAIKENSVYIGIPSFWDTFKSK